MIYISRNYTEFGPFSNKELLNFLERGVLRREDHFRAHGEDIWWPLDEWLEKAKAEVAKQSVSQAKKLDETVKVKSVAKAKKVAKKTAKKAAKKATAKSDSK